MFEKNHSKPISFLESTLFKFKYTEFLGSFFQVTIYNDYPPHSFSLVIQAIELPRKTFILTPN